MLFGKISITSKTQNVVVGEEIEIKINTENSQIASFEIEINFDQEKLEYISGEQNSNIQENVLLYVWVDSEGGMSSKQNEEIGTFKFRAKKTGRVMFDIKGKFFDAESKEITVEFQPLEVNIAEAKTVENLNDTIKQNANLESIAVENFKIGSKEPIDNTEYTLTVPNNIESINIFAVPENEKATITVGEEIKPNRTAMEYAIVQHR